MCLIAAFFTMSMGHLIPMLAKPAMWTTISVTFFVMAIFLQVYSIRISNLIYAFSKLDSEVTGRVVEEEEERRMVEHLVREKILAKLEVATGNDSHDTSTEVRL